MRAGGQMLWIALAITCAASAQALQATSRVIAPNLILEFDSTLQSRLIARFDGVETPLDDFRTTESVVVAEEMITGFRLKSTSRKTIKDAVGKGVRYLLCGE